MTDSTHCTAGGLCSSSPHGGIPVPLGSPHDAAVSHHGCSRASSPWHRASWRCAYAPWKGRRLAWRRFFVNCLDQRELSNKLVEQQQLFFGRPQNRAVKGSRDQNHRLPDGALHRVCASRGTNEDKHSSNQPWGYFLGDRTSFQPC